MAAPMWTEILHIKYNTSLRIYDLFDETKTYLEG